MIKVLFIAAEAIPYMKTGGLGEVVGSLPKALLKQGIDVRIIIPKYRDLNPAYREKMVFRKDFDVPLAWRKQYGGILTLEEEGLVSYFLDNEYYFKRDGFYGYYDEAERFAYFSRAVLRSLPFLDFKPDIVHCHDWHTGLIPLFLKSFYQEDEFYRNIKSVFTIHNLKYQGLFSHWILGDLLDLSQRYFTPDKLEYHGQVNFMKGGIVFADQVTTVSKTYAEEIKSAYYGEGLDGILRNHSYKLRGILNGIDYQDYNPQTDPRLKVRYTNRQGKMLNKLKLQKELGLIEKENIPLLAIVSRLTEQKGLDLFLHIFEEIIQEDFQLVILGTGEKKYEDFFQDKAYHHGKKVKALIKFDEGLARRIYASADILLMPSKFEPCGLSQMIALRYGALPLVRETGGLKDTVIPYNEYTQEGNGFSFTNYNAHDLMFTMRKALKLYKNKATWEKIVNNALLSDFSWDESALKYLALYEQLKAGG